MNTDTLLLFFAGAVLTAAYFKSQTRKRVNADQQVSTVNPSLTTAVEGRSAPARGPVKYWAGPVDFTAGSDIVAPYGGSARMTNVVRSLDVTSPQYINTLTK